MAAAEDHSARRLGFQASAHRASGARQSRSARLIAETGPAACAIDDVHARHDRHHASDHGARGHARDQPRDRRKTPALPPAAPVHDPATRTSGALWACSWGRRWSPAMRSPHSSTAHRSSPRCSRPSRRAQISITFETFVFRDEIGKLFCKALTRGRAARRSRACAARLAGIAHHACGDARRDSRSRRRRAAVPRAFLVSPRPSQQSHAPQAHDRRRQDRLYRRRRIRPRMGTTTANIPPIGASHTTR